MSPGPSPQVLRIRTWDSRAGGVPPSGTRQHSSCWGLARSYHQDDPHIEWERVIGKQKQRQEESQCVCKGREKERGERQTPRKGRRREKERKRKKQGESDFVAWLGSNTIHLP